MVPNAEIHGAGIAAQACCSLLRKFGWHVNTPAPGAAHVPYLVINSVTATLIKDVFSVDASSLGGWEISRRLVVSHLDKSVSKMTDSALVVGSDALRFLLAAESTLSSLQGRDPWGLFAGELPPQGQLIQSGKRVAWIFEATNTGAIDDRSAIFEFIPEGWFFWAPMSTRKGFLQFVLPQTQDHVVEICRSTLAHTRLLKNAVVVGECVAGPLLCAAAIHTQLTGSDWIVTGKSALRYDPISGDGTGASLRSAILACATLRTLTETKDSERYVDHYSWRLRKAFQAHARACESLYARAGLSAAWEDEIRCLHGLSLDNSSKETGTSGLQLCNYRLTLA